MTRTDARELMMTIYYQMDINKEFDINASDSYFNDKRKIKGQEEYCREAYSLLCNKKDAIDEKINKVSRGWSVNRMPKTDLAIVRLAVCELLFMDEVPAAVSINEAVDLAKKFGTDNAPKYINAVLGAIEKESSNEQ